MGKMEEQILVVRRDELFDNERRVFQGYLPLEKAEEITENFPELHVKRRGCMEEDPTYKQIIPYTVVIDKETGDWLVYKRLSNSGEQRLVGQTSVGVGGHANGIDGIVGIDELLKENGLRELNEELLLSEDVNIMRLGYVNNDDGGVGDVHLGVVYKAEVTSKNVVECLETDVLDIGWATLEELREDDLLEDWSKIIVKNSVSI